MRASASLAERFWSKVDKSGHDECWPWLGALDKGGYGRLNLGGRGAPKKMATWVAWTICVGTVPPGLFLCHRCDNTRCVNPSHLFLGTHVDNMRDMAAKGRAAEQRGSKDHNAKITEADVVEMRRLYWVDGVAQMTLRERWPLSKGSVSDIVRGITWSHVPMPASNDAEKETA